MSVSICKKRRRPQKRSLRLIPGQPVLCALAPTARSFSPSKSFSLQLHCESARCRRKQRAVVGRTCGIFLKQQNRHAARPTLRGTLAHQIRPSDRLLRHARCCTVATLRHARELVLVSYPMGRLVRRPLHIAHYVRRTRRRFSPAITIPRPEKKDQNY